MENEYQKMKPATKMENNYQNTFSNEMTISNVIIREVQRQLK